jgi:hypothetical protein
VNWSHFSAYNPNNTNQSLIMLLDGSSPQGAQLQDLNISSSTGLNDYCGTGLVIRPGLFDFKLANLTFQSGPSNSSSYIGTTLCPEVYFGADPGGISGVFSLINWHFLPIINFSARSFYQLDSGGAEQDDTFDTAYCQGCIEPLVGIQNLVGGSGFRYTFKNFTQDTSPTADVGFWGSFAHQITLQDFAIVSNEAHGTPPYITGLAPTLAYLINNHPPSSGRYMNVFPLTATTGSIGGSALTAGQCATGSVTVPDATTTMTVQVSPNTYPGDGYPWIGWINTNGTVIVRVCAEAAGTPTASTYNVRVTQ